MFERFSTAARRVVVQAQEEARKLQHNYIGTEHLLLGLLTEQTGIACRALTGLGMSIEGVQQDVIEIIGSGTKAPSGHIPFTPRAKKTLELSLREALQLQHDHIGTEHLLLGLLKEAERDSKDQGVAARILQRHAPLPAIRTTVLSLVPQVSVEASPPRHWLRRTAAARTGRLPELGQEWEPGAEQTGEQSVLSATPAADATLSEAAKLAGAQPVGSHHLMLASLADPGTAAARALAALGVDLDQAKEALRGIDVTGTSDELPEEAGRRQMVIRVTSEQLTLEAADPVLVKAGNEALAALGDQAKEAGVIHGDLPASASLSRAWQALLESVEDIRQRAASSAGPSAGASASPPAQTSAQTSAEHQTSAEETSSGPSAGASADGPDTPDSGPAG